MPAHIPHLGIDSNIEAVGGKAGSAASRQCMQSMNVRIHCLGNRLRHSVVFSVNQQNSMWGKSFLLYGMVHQRFPVDLCRYNKVLIMLCDIHETASSLCIDYSDRKVPTR